MDKQQIALGLSGLIAPLFLWLYLTSGRIGKQLVQKYLPEGRFKNILLKKVD